MRGGMNILSMMNALCSVGGFIAPARNPSGYAWRRPRNVLWRDDPQARDRAQAKRARRAQRNLSHAAVGGYGPSPFVKVAA